MADKVVSECKGREARVVDLNHKLTETPPPHPFNLGDLQHEAYSVFGFSPRKTLNIAEGLYLDSYISYPRTDSQQIPPSIQIKKILSKLSHQKKYRAIAESLLRGLTLVLLEALRGQDTNQKF